MRKMYNKTDDSKCKAGHVIRFRNRHDASSRSGLLLRLGCAALALMLAVGGVSLLRSSFEAQLPMVHAEEDEIEIDNSTMIRSIIGEEYSCHRSNKNRLKEFY